MNSLKDKFDDYREEPRTATWQKLLERLDTEMPVANKRRYGLWILPFLVVGTSAIAWMWFVANSPIVKTADTAPNIPYKSITVENHEAATSPAIVAALSAENTPVIARYQGVQQPLALQSETPRRNTNLLNAFVGYKYFPSASIMDVKSSLLPVDKNLLIASNLVADSTAFAENPDSIINAGSSTALKPSTSPENNFLLEIYYAPGISNILLKDPVMPLFSGKTVSENKALRKSISKTGFSFTTGFGVKMALNNKFRAKTGFYITQVNQTLYYNAEASVCNCKTAKLATLDPKINDANMGNSTDTITKGNKFTANNKYSLQEIPLVFEYTVFTNKKINSVATFGVSYMYMRGMNIKMPDADNVGFLSIVSKTSDVTIFPAYKDAVNLIFGYGLVYNAKRNVEWSLMPQFKLAVTSLSKDVHWFREYPWQFHVGMGVGKKF